MAKSTQEWFLILDDKLRVVGLRSYPDVTAAILAANHLAPWPEFRGRLVVRSGRAASGAKVGDGAGRVAAIREGGRWSGPDVVAGRGYLVDPSLEAAHERKYNLPQTTKTPAQLRREIEEAFSQRRTKTPSKKSARQLSREIADAFANRPALKPERVHSRISKDDDGIFYLAAASPTSEALGPPFATFFAAKRAAMKLVREKRYPAVEVWHRWQGGRYMQGMASGEGWSDV